MSTTSEVYACYTIKICKNKPPKSFKQRWGAPVLHPPLTWEKYCKCITFDDVSFLAPLAVVSLPPNQQHRWMRIYKAMNKWIKIKCQMRSMLYILKFKVRQISYTLNIIRLQYSCAGRFKHIDKQTKQANQQR